MIDVIAPDATRDPAAPANAWHRLLAVFEVSILALLVPVARVGFAAFTPPGVFSSVIKGMGAGVIIIAPTVYFLILLRGKKIETYGIAAHGWPENLKIGVVLSLLCASVVVASGPIFRMAGVNHFTGYEVRGRLVALCVAVPFLILFVWILRATRWIAKRISMPLAGICCVGLWGLPLVLARLFGHPIGGTLITLGGSVLVAGLGEELIFRGYIQSRVNEAFGRPFRGCGIEFGWGIFIASFLFGVVHVFNGFDPVQGRFQLQWTWGVFGCMSGLIFGYLREKTGSILSGAVLHGNNDAWVLIVQNLR